jgi:hypothetical protein
MPKQCRTILIGKKSERSFSAGSTKMTSQTKRVFAAAAIIVATGITAVELSRTPAQAEGTSSYVTTRIESAFDVAAAIPAVQQVRVPMAVKGDLPVPQNCAAISGDAQAECMDVAYEVPSQPSVVVETRSGSTSTLMRMDSLTVAGVESEQGLSNE